jgi:hypothetical protein
MAALHRTAAAAPTLIRQRSSWIIFGIIAALLVGIAAFQVSQFSSLTNTSYEINELNRIRAEKQARNHELEAEVGRLSSLARVDIEARVELGLQPSTKVMHIGVNLPAPTHQTLPSRFQPIEQPTTETSGGEGWIERLIKMVPFF